MGKSEKYKDYTGKTLEECKRKYKLYSDAEEEIGRAHV